MSKHTPGPWHIQDRGDTGNGPAAVGIICGPAHSSDWVADVGLLHDGAGGGSMANAHLIAAAPDLLEALQAFLRAPSIGSKGPGSLKIEVQTFNLDAARAAIAKAEGTSND